ncbi:MAG: hypothetical protein Q4G50_03465 [Corynebacterium sp.]|uniref:hypothetical protein n=1 Tax=Corynebacterium sp. TaxID=1720 RepID=UPI0026DEC8C9|nr:hypothetical protein [Corynebacterium sp.]MDO5669042.1 hypothetical protein [Corynebacterium sp.]
MAAEGLIVLGLFAVLIVVLVAVTAYRRPTSPSFWVAFPLTCLSAVFLLHRFLPVSPISAAYGWSVYMPLPGSGFLTPSPWEPIMWSALLIVGVLASVWTWRRGSVEE